MFVCRHACYQFSLQFSIFDVFCSLKLQQRTDGSSLICSNPYSYIENCRITQTGRTSESPIVAQNPEVSKKLVFYKFIMSFKCCYAMKFYTNGSVEKL